MLFLFVDPLYWDYIYASMVGEATERFSGWIFHNMLKYFKTSLASSLISAALLLALSGAFLPLAEVHAHTCQQCEQHQPADSTDIPCSERCCFSIPLSATIPADLGIDIDRKPGPCHLNGHLPSLISSEFVRLIEYPPIFLLV